ADHAVAHVPGFMKENKLPGGTVNEKNMLADLNAVVKDKFGVEGAVVSLYNYQVHLDRDKLDSLKADKTGIINAIISFLKKKESVSNAFATADILTTPIPKVLREKLANGFFYNRSGDVQIILKPGYIDGGATGTTHGLWYPYDAHIPLLWYGWGIKKGRSAREVHMHDIASTIAALLHIQEPSGNIGQPITEVLK
ncbi:MAG: alkaline phosphatase family protein, partial [Sediminibacterium sp.]